MNFDAGTWWLALLLLGGLTGGFWFLLKRTVFERVDKLERSVGESVKKGDYDKDMKEVREDIEKIKANYITKEDFFREQAKTDRKLDRIMDILLEMKGDTRPAWNHLWRQCRPHRYRPPQCFQGADRAWSCRPLPG